MCSEPKETPLMRFGRLAHQAVLEPERFARAVTVWTGSSRRGSVWNAFCRKHRGREIVTQAERARLNRIAAAVRSHCQAKHFLDGARTEISVTWETKRYGPAKARFDALAGDALVELKLTGDVSPFAFERTAYRMGYHLQLGWYDEAQRKAKLGVKDFILVAVEAEEPFDVIVYRPLRMYVSEGRKLAVKLARAYWRAQGKGSFAGQSDDVEPLRLPGYAIVGPAALTIGGKELAV